MLKTSISQDLGLTNADYAAVQNSFLVFYGISQMVSGRIYDVIGTRRGFMFSIVVWSVAALAHATAQLGWRVRCVPRVAGLRRSRQLARRRQGGRRMVPGSRARAGMGIFNTGAAVGGALSPPIIALARDRVRLAA